MQISDNYLLFDAGRGVTTQVVQVGIQPQYINPIFITHFHFDHIGNLGDLLLSSWNNGRTQPLLLYGPKGLKEIISSLLDSVYASDISFRLKEAHLTQGKLVDIREIVRVQEVAPGLVYDSGNWRIYADYVDHGHGFGISLDNWACLGFRLEIGDKIIAISGDTVDCPGIRRLADNADLLIMCSYLAESEINTPDAALIATHILASPSTAGRIAAQASVRRLVLTHIREKSDILLQTMIDDAARYFAGEIILAQDLLQIKL